MKISIEDPRVWAAIQLVKDIHSPKTPKELSEIFEQHYHCKIVIEDDPWCTRGHLFISEEKYQTWFVIQFGDKG